VSAILAVNAACADAVATEMASTALSASAMATGIERREIMGPVLQWCG
jgi:hypothetical protein